MAVVMMVSLLPAMTLSAASSGMQDASTWVLGSAERPEYEGGKPAQPTNEVDIYGLKNETTSFQIVVQDTMDGALTINDLEISDLEGPGGEKILGNTLIRNREQFIFVEDGQQSESYGGHNTFEGDVYIADPLIPFNDPTTGDALNGSLKAIPYTIPQGKNAAFWIDVPIPKAATEGEYTGMYTIKTADGDISGKITLTVWNYELPDVPLSDFHVGGGGSNKDDRLMYMRNRIQESSTLTKAEFDDYGYRGLKGMGAGQWADMSWGQSADDMELPVENTLNAINGVQTGYEPGDVFWYSYLADETESAYEEFIAESWDTWVGTDSNYFYNTHDVFREKLYEWRKVLKAANIPVLLCIVTKPYIDLIDDYDLFNADPDNAAWIAANGPKQPGEGEPLIDVFVTLDSLFNAPYIDRQGNEIDGYTVADVTKMALAKGSKVWSYSALVQDDHTPTWSLDASLMDYRMPGGFINQNFGMDGTLNWRMTYDASKFNTAENWEKSQGMWTIRAIRSLMELGFTALNRLDLAQVIPMLNP